MTILLALALYGGTFAGYVLGDTQYLKTLSKESSTSMETLRSESHKMISELNSLNMYTLSQETGGK